MPKIALVYAKDRAALHLVEEASFSIWGDKWGDKKAKGRFEPAFA
jgi:hypothetical protein